MPAHRLPVSCTYNQANECIKRQRRIPVRPTSTRLYLDGRGLFCKSQRVCLDALHPQQCGGQLPAGAVPGIQRGNVLPQNPETPTFSLSAHLDAARPQQRGGQLVAGAVAGMQHGDQAPQPRPYRLSVRASMRRVRSSAAASSQPAPSPASSAAISTPGNLDTL